LSGAHNKNKVTRIANTDGIIQGPGNVLAQGTAPVSRYKLDSLLDFSMDLKLMVFYKSTRSKRYVTPNGAPYFADQRQEMFVLLIKIKMEQSMIKTKYIWAI
jgi:hypothetical protein